MSSQKTDVLYDYFIDCITIIGKSLNDGVETISLGANIPRSVASSEQNGQSPHL